VWDRDGTLIVATQFRLVRVHPATKKVDVLIGDAFWAGLRPNSLIVSQGAIFIGMRHGVAKVEKQGRAYQVKWLLPVPDFDRMIRIPGGSR
jgi:hypothetical protein